MSSRRGFLGQMLAGVVTLGWASRNLLAQVRAGYLMESAPGTETVINGKRYLYFGGPHSRADQPTPRGAEEGRLIGVSLTADFTRSGRRALPRPFAHGEVVHNASAAWRGCRRRVSAGR